MLIETTSLYKRDANSDRWQWVAVRGGMAIRDNGLTQM
jgi:hypothetical protein